jgi:signal transduction histidine kinase
VQITVRDHGVGFDVRQTGPGFGLRQSVIARLEEVDGTVSVWSEPGRGTRVTLWAPAR